MSFTVKDWKDSPDTTTPLSAAALEDMETRLSAYSDARISYQTSLPGSPSDGDMIAFAADATNGVIWHLRYRSAASGSYKWEFLGGPPLWAEVLTFETATVGGSYSDFATVGPSVTVPLAGDYLLDYSGCIWPPVSLQTLCSPRIGATAALDADAIAVHAGDATGSSANVATQIRKTAVAASAVIKLQGRTTGAAGAGGVDTRRLSVRPIRVG